MVKRSECSRGGSQKLHTKFSHLGKDIKIKNREFDKFQEIICERFDSSVVNPEHKDLVTLASNLLAKLISKNIFGKK